jgi:hypothetical protein
MNDRDVDAQLDALFALARANRPDTSAAEFAFETRLMARLRSQKEASSVWAMVSWKLIPFFAACLVALTLWQSEAATETADAEQTCYVQNSGALDSWNSLN